MRYLLIGRRGSKKKEVKTDSQGLSLPLETFDSAPLSEDRGILELTPNLNCFKNILFRSFDFEGS